MVQKELGNIDFSVGFCGIRGPYCCCYWKREDKRPVKVLVSALVGITCGGGEGERLEHGRFETCLKGKVRHAVAASCVSCVQ